MKAISHTSPSMTDIFDSSIHRCFQLYPALKIGRPSRCTAICRSVSGKSCGGSPRWKPPFFMGISTISVAIFKSYVKLPRGTYRAHKFGWKIKLFIQFCRKYDTYNIFFTKKRELVQLRETTLAKHLSRSTCPVGPMAAPRSKCRGRKLLLPLAMYR